jgi:hypothetical protein
MIASENEAKPDPLPKDSRSSLPARNPSLSANDMEGTHTKDKRAIGTPGARLRDHTPQLGAHPLSLAGLSPLDSADTTTTEQSTATNIMIQLQTELVATANELYRKGIEGRVHREGRTGKTPERVLAASSPPFPEILARANTRKLTDEDYWSSFPPHIKQFVRSIAS